MFKLSLTFVVSAALFAAACGKKSEATDETAAAAAPAVAPATAAAAAPAPAARAQEIFKTQCVVCHGESGKGDGAGAAALDPKPRNYTDTEWQAKTDVARIMTVILEGGAANGLNAAMPPYAAQIDGTVADELVKIVRGFGA